MITLQDLKDAISNGSDVSLLDGNGNTAGISDALTLKFGDTEFKLDESIALNSSINATIRAIYNAWTMRDLTTAEYVSQSQQNSIAIITFQNKVDLIRFFEGQDQSIEPKPKVDELAASKGVKEAPEVAEDPIYVSAVEDNLLHDTLFQGEKLVDFSYLKKDAQNKIINILKSDKNGKKLGGKVEKPGAVPKKNANPVILLSPATSALIQMSNIKEFLENGTFKDPSLSAGKSQGSSNLVFVKKTLPVLGPQTFVVVNSTDFFTKSDYWSRVVAIFTTGQSWQFKNYITRDPEELFQKFKGFYIGYEGDFTNANIDKWNVEVIKLDRNRRFNDKEVSEQFWASLEKAMIHHGYKN